MALRLYRRHFRLAGKCTGGHVADSRTYESDELRRGWKKCRCPIYASGTIGKTFGRRNTECLDWVEAKSAASAWEGAGAWDGRLAKFEAPSPLPEDSSTNRTSIDRAVKAFLAAHAETSAYNTQKNYRLLLNRFVKYSGIKGYLLIDQWGPIDVREFRTSWDVSPVTASKQMTFLKSFFEFSLNNEWISRNPARLVKDARGKSVGKERVPFSDDEIKRMFEACETKYGKAPIRWSRKAHHKEAFGETVNYRYRWSGQDLADFISVSLYTGLRISDVCTFHIDRLLDTGECHIRTAKNGRKVYTWVPDWLQERIRKRPEQYGPLIFGSHTSRDMNVITDVWRRKLKRLWDLCGPWPESPTPHRFRHTFARILLQKPDVTVRDVAELMGDTEEMVRKHYSAWVKERQERLTQVLRDAFEDKPRPKLVKMPSRA